MSAWRRQVVKLGTGGLLGLVLLSGRSGAVEPEPRLEGWVRLASGQPAAGVQVRLFSLTDPRRSVGTTADAEGYFALAAPRLADARPQDFALLQNYPNPFNPSTIIPYQLSAPTHVRLEIFNVLGQHIATLVDREQPAGRYTATWHGTDAAGRAVAAGLYLYRIRGTGPSETRRMVLIDGPVHAPGAAIAAEPPANLAASEPTYGLTVSGRDVVTHIDPAFQASGGPVEIVVEARTSTTGLAAMKETTSDRIWGDVDANGQVDIFDALLVGLYSLDASITIPNDGDIFLGDVNRDGRIDITDAYLIATYSVNPTDPSLPPGIGTPRSVVAEGKMYWVDRREAKVQRANLDGSQIEDLVTTGLKQPTDLALDLDEGKMYWTDRLSNRIQRANLDGSQVEDLVTGLGDIWSLALDITGGKMYWTDAAWPRQKIQRANLDGSQIEDLVTTGLFQIAGLALDIAGGKMYWTDYGTDKIHRANLDGSRVEALVTTGLDFPNGLALDLAGGKMYWADRDKIRRANLNGSQVEDLLWEQHSGSLVLVLPEKKMYWTKGGRILRANLDGSQVEDLLSAGLRSPRSPQGLALDLADMPEIKVNRPPVLDGIGKQSVAEGELLRIDLVARDPEGDEVTYEAESNAPGVATVSVSDRQLTISPVTLGVATVAVMASDASDATTTQTFTVKVTVPIPESRGRMYWTDWETDKIQRANLDGSQVEDLVSTGLDYPSGLALDVAGGKMYWIDAGTDKIQRANLDGSQVEDLVTTGLFVPRNLALDVAGGKIYWTDEDWDEGRISRANLDGSQVEDLLTEVGTPAGLALDLAAGKMYWTDTGRSRIGRTNLDGSQFEDLVTPSLNSPRALALDVAGGKIYWTDSGTLRMQRANLDGSQVEDVVVSGLGYPTIGLALDVAGGKIYWTDSGTKDIRRANLDGTRIEDLVTGLSEPVGLALEIVVPDAPDLVVASPSVNPPNLASSQSFTLSVAIHNRGNAPAPPTTVCYYRSNDSTITNEDIEVGTSTVSGSAAPSTTFKLIRLTAPSSPGTYYYGACVQSVSGERDIENNCSSASKVVVVAQ